MDQSYSHQHALYSSTHLQTTSISLSKIFFIAKCWLTLAFHRRTVPQNSSQQDTNKLCSNYYKTNPDPTQTDQKSVLLTSCNAADPKRQSRLNMCQSNVFIWKRPISTPNKQISQTQIR